MAFNIIIYILLAGCIAINAIAFYRRRTGITVEHSNSEFISPMIRISNWIVLANVAFTLVSVIFKACEAIGFETYITLLFISLGLIALGSLLGFFAVVGEYIELRKKGKMQEFAANRRGRLRLMLQLLLSVFGITWIIVDYMMISFNWFDIFLRLITFTPLQEIPAPGITYCVLLYLIAISPAYDMLSINFHRKK